MLNYRADNAMAKDTKMIQKHDFSLQKTKRLTLRHVPHCSLRLHTNKNCLHGGQFLINLNSFLN